MYSIDLKLLILVKKYPYLRKTWDGTIHQPLWTKLLNCNPKLFLIYYRPQSLLHQEKRYLIIDTGKGYFFVNVACKLYKTRW